MKLVSTGSVLLILKLLRIRVSCSWEQLGRFEKFLKDPNDFVGLPKILDLFYHQHSKFDDAKMSNIKEHDKKRTLDDALTQDEQPQNDSSSSVCP